MFNVFYGFLDYTKQAVCQMYRNMLLILNYQRTYQEEELTSDEINEINKNLSAKDTYEYYIDNSKLAIPTDRLNENYENKTNKTIGIKNYRWYRI